MRVLASPYVYMSPLYLAHEQGYFAAERLQVRIESHTGANTAIPLLAGGQADATFYAISPALVNAISRGAQVRIVAGRQFIAAECADDRRLMGARAAFPEGFREFRQLKGKRVGLTNPSSNTAFQMDACLAAGGLTRAEIEMVLVKGNEGAVMIGSGNLDVLMSSTDEMYSTRLQEKVIMGPSLAEALPGYMYSYIVFGQRFFTGDSDAGVRFLRAYLRGAADFVEGRNPQFLLDFVRRNGLDPETPSRLCRAGTATDGRLPMTDIQRFLEWCVTNKYSTAMPAEALVDTRFLDGCAPARPFRGRCETGARHLAASGLAAGRDPFELAVRRDAWRFGSTVLPAADGAGRHGSRNDPVGRSWASPWRNGVASRAGLRPRSSDRHRYRRDDGGVADRIAVAGAGDFGDLHAAEADAAADGDAAGGHRGHGALSGDRGDGVHSDRHSYAGRGARRAAALHRNGAKLRRIAGDGIPPRLPAGERAADFHRHAAGRRALPGGDDFSGNGERE
ncbi:MAG: ABC transporter substrate-binding protein [Bryobacteraceae bacterium]|nr:ABC transporter substrate-binding protein [Bryobacteraceae bacterium]